MWQCHGFPVPAPPVLIHRRSGSRPARVPFTDPVRGSQALFCDERWGNVRRRAAFRVIPLHVSKRGSTQTTRFPCHERGFDCPGGEIIRFPPDFRAQVLRNRQGLVILKPESAMAAQGHRDTKLAVPLRNKRDAAAGPPRKGRPCFRASFERNAQQSATPFDGGVTPLPGKPDLGVFH